METTQRLTKAEIIVALRQRDGEFCMHPDCKQLLDFTLTEGRNLVTIDHVFPQSRAKKAGWTYEQIWDLNNLTLMHKRCNARKADRLYLEDGTLPPPKQSTFRFRREKRADRPQLNTCCNNGRALDYDQICGVCGSEAQPKTFPAWAKVKSNECTHEGPWSCWACINGFVEREPAIVTVLDGSVLEDDRIIGSAEPILDDEEV